MNAVLKAEKLPARIADLDASLADVDADCLTHGYEDIGVAKTALMMREDFRELTLEPKWQRKVLQFRIMFHKSPRDLYPDWQHVELSGSIWRHMAPYGAAWRCMALYDPIRGHSYMALYGAIRRHKEPCSLTVFRQ